MKQNESKSLSVAFLLVKGILSNSYREKLPSYIFLRFTAERQNTKLSHKDSKTESCFGLMEFFVIIYLPSKMPEGFAPSFTLFIP